MGQSQQNKENGSKKSKDKREINEKKKGGGSLMLGQEQYNDAEGKCMPIKLNVSKAKKNVDISI